MFPVDVLIKSHEGYLADAQQGRPQVARGSQHCRDGVFVKGRSSFELLEGFAFGDKDFGGRFGDSPSVLLLQLLARRDDLFYLNAVGLHKLGRFYTARSTVAVIMPIYFFCHGAP